MIGKYDDMALVSNNDIVLKIPILFETVAG